MTIIIAHKPINRSDTIGVMWNHIICTAAVPYNKKVTIFPCQSAPCTFPVFRITRHPLTTIYSSLPAIITIKRSTCGKRVNRQINIAACVSLSATGSSIFPKLLILWNLLAIYPSARSVRPDSNKISPATPNRPPPMISHLPQWKMKPLRRSLPRRRSTLAIPMSGAAAIQTLLLIALASCPGC